MAQPAWIRPSLRVATALALPLLVPAMVTAALWVLPGDAVEVLCPPGLCTGGAELAARWHLDAGPWSFYVHWLGGALRGEFGTSWRMAQGTPVADLLWESVAPTLTVVLGATLVLTAAAWLVVVERLPIWLDGLWTAVGLAPTVLLALLATAWVEITYGALSHDGWPGTLRVGLAILGLVLADGMLADAVGSTRSLLSEERKARYVSIAVLRGESALANMAPNVLPVWIGMWRGRILHLISGGVIVEIVLGVPGLGELLWEGTRLQDFGVVLAAAWAYAWLSSAILATVAGLDAAVAWWVRRAPAVRP